MSKKRKSAGSRGIKKLLKTKDSDLLESKAQELCTRISKRFSMFDNCLVASLGLKYALGFLGIPKALALGKKGSGESFEAHAWLE